ncbi:hypothetical protein BHE74_00025788, partial [Ensete ventricosum]
NCEPSTNRSAAATVSRSRSYPAPRREEVAALPRLKSPTAEAIAILPRLESLIAEATAVLPCLNSPQNDCRREIAQGSNRPPLPACRSVRKEAGVPSTNRKRKRKPTLRKVACKIEFRLVFRTPSENFKILAIPDILAHEKSYEHGFTKKRDGPKLCAKSSFDRFFAHHFGISKYSPFLTY